MCDIRKYDPLVNIKCRKCLLHAFSHKSGIEKGLLQILTPRVSIWYMYIYRYVWIVKLIKYCRF